MRCTIAANKFAATRIHAIIYSFLCHLMGPNGQKWPRRIIPVHLLHSLYYYASDRKSTPLSPVYDAAKWKCYSNALLNYAFYIKFVWCTSRVWPCGCVPKIIKFIAQTFSKMLWVLLCIEPERNSSQFHSTISKCSGEFERWMSAHTHNPHAAESAAARRIHEWRTVTKIGNI